MERKPNQEDPDIAALFDPANYLHFNDRYLNSERTQLEVAFIRERFGVEESFSVLDLACGHGRHANIIARDVHRVVGVDISAEFLDLARASAESMGVRNVRYVLSDIRDLDYTSEFDRVMLLNTVFGLFGDAQNDDLLKRIHRALKPSGRLCFDVVNRDMILVDYRPEGIVEKDGDFMLDRLQFDERTGRMMNRRVYIRDGRATAAPFSLRLYNYTEIQTILIRAKFRIVDVFANWRAAPMDFKSTTMVIVAERV